MIKLLKGDSSTHLVDINIPDAALESGAVLEFMCGDMCRAFPAMPQIELKFDGEWTAAQSPGRMLASWTLVSPEGDRATLTNTYPIYITIDAAEVGTAGSVSAPVVPSVDLSDLKALDPSATPGETKELLNEILRRLRSACIVLAIGVLALVSVAATAYKSPLDQVHGTDGVVTNVSFEGLATTADVEQITTDALKGLAQTYRKIGDDQAYAVKSVGEIVSWSCPGRPELVAALTGCQPDVYDYGDGYQEYYISFEADGNYWYGWAYERSDATDIHFSIYCDIYDDEWGWIGSDYADVTAHRGVAEYDLENPIDRFATKGEVSESVGSIRDGVNHLTGLLTSETKLWRTGKPNECGHGWGYMQHNLTNDLRRWRIRVPYLCPHWINTAVSNATYTAKTHSEFKKYYRDGLFTRSISGGKTNYTAWTSGLGGTFNRSSYFYTFMEDWMWDLQLTSTRGVQGTDAVTGADYIAKMGNLMSWDVEQIDEKILTRVPINGSVAKGACFGNAYPATTNVFYPYLSGSHTVPVYRITPKLHGENYVDRLTDGDLGDSVRIPISTMKFAPAVVSGTETLYDANHDIVTFVWTNRTETTPIAFRTLEKPYVVSEVPDYSLSPRWKLNTPAPHTDISYPYTTIAFPMKFEFKTTVVRELYEYHAPASDSNNKTLVSVSTNTLSYTDTDGYMFAGFMMLDQSKLDTMYSQAYRLMGTYDSNLFYDSALDCTFRIVSSNGCFYTELHHPGDWREKAWR